MDKASIILSIPLLQIIYFMEKKQNNISAFVRPLGHFDWSLPSAALSQNHINSLRWINILNCAPPTISSLAALYPLLMVCMVLCWNLKQIRWRWVKERGLGSIFKKDKCDGKTWLSYLGGLLKTRSLKIEKEYGDF